MPFKCCVPKCRGNYKNGPKVATFAFPKNEEVKRKWLRAINRADFVPTVYTRVCEAHFNPEDVERITSYYVERTGEFLTAPLSNPRLRKDAVPKMFSWSPQYVIHVPHREVPEEKRIRLEPSMLIKALQESVKTQEKYIKARGFKSLQELDTKLASVNLGKWIQTKRNNKVFLLYFNEDNNSVPCNISISDKLSVNVFCGGLKVSLPTENRRIDQNTVDNLTDLENILQDAVNHIENLIGQEFDTSQGKDQDEAVKGKNTQEIMIIKNEEEMNTEEIELQHTEISDIVYAGKEETYGIEDNLETHNSAGCSDTNSSSFRVSNPAESPQPIVNQNIELVPKNEDDSSVSYEDAQKFITDTRQEIDECDALGISWAAKVRRLDEDQKVLAEDLINQVLRRAYFKELTRNTEIHDSSCKRGIAEDSLNMISFLQNDSLQIKSEKDDINA